MDYIPEATQKHIDDLVKTINKLNKERNKLTAENKAQAKQLILSGVSHRRELLIAFAKYIDEPNEPVFNDLEGAVDEYLRN
jgi:hypothetical protein